MAKEATTTSGASAAPKSAGDKSAGTKSAVIKPAATKPAKAKSAGGKVTVEQTGSPIGRPAAQRQTLKGLKLNKIGRRAALEDTPAVRGMIAKVAHLVRVVEEGGSR